MFAAFYSDWNCVNILALIFCNFDTFERWIVGFRQISHKSWILSNNNVILLGFYVFFLLKGCIQCDTHSFYRFNSHPWNLITHLSVTYFDFKFVLLLKTLNQIRNLSISDFHQFKLIIPLTLQFHKSKLILLQYIYSMHYAYYHYHRWLHTNCQFIKEWNHVDTNHIFYSVNTLHRHFEIV